MEEALLPNLPNEIAILCIARVPRSSHPNLSLVCRSWRSLLRLPLFYSTRFDLKCSQQFLYVNIRHNHTLKWFVLDHCDGNPRKINPLPLIPSPIEGGSDACVVLGPRLFELGGRVNGIPSSNVWVYDSRASSWEAGPKMMARRISPLAAVVNGKIYVVGGLPCGSIVDSWAEVFDPNVGSWMPLHCPVVGIRKALIYNCADVLGKLLVVTDMGRIFFNPERMSWWMEKALFPQYLELEFTKSTAVVDGILYCFNSEHEIIGYDGKENRWKQLRVIDTDFMYRPNTDIILATVEGRLWVLWGCSSEVEDFDGWELEWIDNLVLREFEQVEKDFVLRECKRDEIYFVLWEIVVRKESNGGLQGSIVQAKVIMIIPDMALVCNCLALGL